MDLRSAEVSRHETYDVDKGIEHALRLYRNDPEMWKALVRERPFDHNGRMRRDVIQARCTASTEAYIKTLLWIRPKEGDEFGRQEKRLDVWKPLQQKVFSAIKRLRASGKPMWLQILKARQQGCSTICSAILYARAATRFHDRMLVVGHSDDNAAELLEMYKVYHMWLPAWMRPLTRADNRNELWFQNPRSKERSMEPGLGGRISIDTARDTDAGAGYTITGFHGSECARDGWVNAPSLFHSLHQAIPQPHVNPNTILFVESTAEGQQGWFYDTWNRCVEGKGAYETLFVGFWEEPTYSLDPERWLSLTAKEIRSDLDERETKMIVGCRERYGYEISDGQLAWRRWMVDKYCGGDPDAFDNQYPWCPEVAFRSSGVQVFDLAAIASMRADCHSPKIIGRMDAPKTPVPDQWMHIQPDVIPIPDPKGSVRIYTLPETDVSYTLILDPSDGFPDSDMQAVQVFALKDGRRPEQVAVIESKTPLHQWVDQAYLLGRFYADGAGTEPLFVPEVNKEGAFVCGRLLSYGCLVWIREDAMKVKNLVENKYGFLLTKSSKPKGRNALAKAIHNKSWVFRDSRTLDQLQSWVVVNRPDGTVEYEGAPRGVRPEGSGKIRGKAYDDLADCCIIFAYLESDLPAALETGNSEESEKRKLDLLLDSLVGSPLYDGRRCLQPYKPATEDTDRLN